LSISGAARRKNLGAPVIPEASRHHSAKRALQIAIGGAAVRLENLRVPPGNRLEALRGDRKDNIAFASIAVADLFQVVNGNAHDVEITDYH